ncbi:MAG: ArsR family transcriptional regulator [Actinobacteria bacterium]|nr:ArsR family transcriptional regulator [Actinomycetota bacterium]
MSDTRAAERVAEPVSLVRLLGEQRAAVVERLRDVGEATIAELAEHLGISEVATRRHVNLLDEDGFVEARTVKQDRGRPASTYKLTDRARDLFPQRYAAVASELLDFITAEHGREGLRSYLRWRLDRETATYADIVTAEELHERLDQLAGALSDNGYDARVVDDGEGFELHQTNCAIYDVAKDHPEMCQYEAATFSRVLGRDVAVRRRLTLAEGGHSCVCTVTPKPSGQKTSNEKTTTTDEPSDPRSTP